jgi:type IV pilus assembly protein PilQ
MVENGNVIRIDTLASLRSAQPDYSDPNLRVPLAKKIFTPKYASVSALASEMEKGKSMRGSVRVIGNDIYVEDDYQAMEALTEIFSRNDKVTKQILIEGRIVEASTSFTQSLGVRWGAGYDHVQGGGSNLSNRSYAQLNPGLATGEFTPGEIYGAVTQNEGVARLGVGFLNKAGTLLLNAELNASESLNETKTIASPRIMASNDVEVSIKQGTQFPSVTPATANNPATTTYIEAFLELKVKPHIEENGEIVTLEIMITKDSIPPNSGADAQIETKEAETTLMVKNGETVVIGGIITDDQNTINERVPGLHAIPILGWLFQTKGIQNEKRELLIFITANIIPISI